MNSYKRIGAVLVTALFATPVIAAVSAEEAKQLGGAMLTPFGAEKAGNKEGTIPEYKGEVIKAPPGYDKATPGNAVDPWNEKPFTITAQNADQYADKLDGTKEMFKVYPGFRMDVYPSHRSATFPQFVLANSEKNATSCKGVEGELKLEGCYAGLPFPLPRTGAEVMWNHLMSYKGQALSSAFESWIVTPEGSPILQNRALSTHTYPFYNSARTGINQPNDLYWEVRVDSTEPARKAGEKIVVLDAVDSYSIGRRAYQYIPGQRRVKLAPDISYDTPSPLGGGGMTMDDTNGFSGALDRFGWKLAGKKEKFIPYNNFKMSDYKKCPGKVVLTKNFPNPDCIRWELHRVWVVEATLKPGFRHIYQKRKFFFDEDGYDAGVVENYNAAGKLWRINHIVYYPLYEGTGFSSSATYEVDLSTGGWVIQGLISERGFGPYAIQPKDRDFYSPDALAGEGIR